MTVQPSIPVAGPYVTDGVKINWDFNFKITAATQMVVRLTDADGSNSQDFTDGFYIAANYVDQDTGGIVVYPYLSTPLPAGKLLYLYRSVPYSQPNRIGNQGGFQPEVHEKTFDLLAMQIQQLDERYDRAVVVQFGEDALTLRTNIADGQALVISGSEIVGGPTATDVANAEAFAIAAAASAAEAEAAAASVKHDFIQSGPFVGTNAMANYALSVDPGSVFNMLVIVDGLVYVPNTDYTLVYVAGAPFVRVLVPTGIVFEVRSGSAIDLNTPAAGSVHAAALDAPLTASIAKANNSLQNNVSATSRLLGRRTAGAGAVEELTPAQANVILGTGLPNFHAKLSAAQAITSATDTKVGFDVKTFDSGNYYDLTNKRYQPLVAGLYMVKAKVRTLGTGLTLAVIRLYKNGVGIISTGDPTASTTQVTVELSSLVRLDGVSDYLEVFANVAATTPSVGGNAGTDVTWFEAIRVSD